MMVIHRTLREGDPTFRDELLNYARNRGHVLNLSNFKDDSSPSGESCFLINAACAYNRTGPMYQNVYEMVMPLTIISNKSLIRTCAAWDYSAWVRTYALFLEERLECCRVLKYDVEAERTSVRFCMPVWINFPGKRLSIP